MPDRHFAEQDPRPVILMGREYMAGPLKVGPRRRLSRFLAGYPRPKPVAVEVQGLVEAMLRAEPEPEPGPDGKADPRTKIRIIETVIRRNVATVVLQAVREARMIAELWPPDPEDHRALGIYRQDRAAYVEFLYCALAPYNPGFTRGDAEDMAGADDDFSRPGLSRDEENRLFEAMNPVPGDSASGRDEAEGEAEEEGPKSSGSGGETRTYRLPENGSRSTTLSSTPA